MSKVRQGARRGNAQPQRTPCRLVSTQMRRLEQGAKKHASFKIDQKSVLRPKKIGQFMGNVHLCIILRASEQFNAPGRQTLLNYVAQGTLSGPEAHKRILKSSLRVNCSHFLPLPPLYPLHLCHLTYTTSVTLPLSNDHFHYLRELEQCTKSESK